VNIDGVTQQELDEINSIIDFENVTQEILRESSRELFVDPGVMDFTNGSHKEYLVGKIAKCLSEEWDKQQEKLSKQQKNNDSALHRVRRFKSVICSKVAEAGYNKYSDECLKDMEREVRKHLDNMAPFKDNGILLSALEIWRSQTHKQEESAPAVENTHFGQSANKQQGPDQQSHSK